VLQQVILSLEKRQWFVFKWLCFSIIWIKI
jgi:hypothetical protein